MMIDGIERLFYDAKLKLERILTPDNFDFILTWNTNNYQLIFLKKNTLYKHVEDVKFFFKLIFFRILH